MITIKDKTFVPFLEPVELEKRIVELARELDKDYEGKNPLFIVVLKGAFLFAAELFKHLSTPCEITFVRLSSYESMGSSGRVKQIIGLEESVQDRHVVIVEDIVDTGLTMAQLTAQLSGQGASSVEIATLLHKPDALREDVRIRYLGFKIENRFVVGFGLDYEEHGRNLAGIHVLYEKGAE
ncbi:hypoxanthine phosphoribosyltransferase [Persicitalea jodogahamensis]|uniref:Hypoxanthine phosphoribosyltransferase n=1 Tax=Persicitalea jodogahamensis TaxID=402147 RepID=A0A8J3D5B1_9BACT|nr:hypoxanthine phosphoribosyltransferase [Persicitalea jodogahamensis]GHB85326.1 hypoxanthine phosphoribosyltransferase [Persicitalea jodogahamensis]